MTGLIVFAVASLLGGLARTRRCCSAARGLQGLGAALASPAALALITTTFPAGPAAQPRLRGVRRDVRRRRGRRPDPRWLAHRPRPRLFGLDIDGWRLTFLINVPIGLVAAAAGPALPRRVRVAPRRARHPRRPHRHLRPARRRLRPDPRRPRARLDRHLDHRQPGRRRRCCSRLFVLHREPRVEHPLLPFRIFQNRTRAASFVAMMLRAGRDVRDVLLPEPVHPERDGLQPAQGRLRVPAVLASASWSAPASASNLVNRIDPRYLAGVGTLMAAAALFGFSRLPYDTVVPGRSRRAPGSYVTDHPAVHRADVARHGR